MNRLTVRSGPADPVSLIRSELRVVTGQPGLTAVLLGPVLVAAAVGVARMVLHVADPLRWPSIGGVTAFAVAGGLTTFLVVVTMVVAGALAGSGGASPATTLARVPALLGMDLALVGLATAACALVAALPHEFDSTVTTAAVMRQAWAALVPATVYGLLGMAVGALLTAPATAVAVSLLLSVAAAPPLVTVSSWSQRVGQLLLPGAVARLSHPGRAAASSLALAVAVILVWLAVPAVAGGIRAGRSQL